MAALGAKLRSMNAGLSTLYTAVHIRIIAFICKNSIMNDYHTELSLDGLLSETPVTRFSAHVDSSVVFPISAAAAKQ